MIRTYEIKHNHWGEVQDWLLDNVSKEGYRWWASKKSGVWNGMTGKYDDDMTVCIEVADEEEPLLTTFILKYA